MKHRYWFYLKRKRLTNKVRDTINHLHYIVIRTGQEPEILNDFKESTDSTLSRECYVSLKNIAYALRVPFGSIPKFLGICIEVQQFTLEWRLKKAYEDNLCS